MIAFDYPPGRTSGVQRTLGFASYLPRFEWEPTVLTASPRAYPEEQRAREAGLGDSIKVVRTFALDVARDLAFRGRYFGCMALPDRWGSWWLSAVPTGLRLIRRLKPDVIWSTYPTPTALLIGLTLHRMSGTPWVADLRDPMPHRYHNERPNGKRLSRWIERQTVKRSRRLVVTTPGAKRLYADAEPSVDGRCTVVSNGFDPQGFTHPSETRRQTAPANGKLTLLHSGTLDLTGRNPQALFEALAGLVRAGRIGPRTLKVVLRASGNEALYAEMVAAHGLQEIVALEPAIDYTAAVREMMSAHGLLVLQGALFNHQIPAKVYEYLWAQKPIFALTDPQGDTAALLRDLRVDTTAPLEDAQRIMEGLGDFLGRIRAGRVPVPTLKRLEAYSRVACTERLAHVLDSCV